MKKNDLIDKLIGVSKFWKIYIFVITLFIIACCVFFLIFSLNLRQYERTAAQQRLEREREAAALRAEEDEAEAQRRFDEKNEKELSAAAALAKREQLLNVLQSAEKTALEHVSVSLDSSPEKVMDALMAELKKKGGCCLSGVLKVTIGKYEDMSSVYKYIDTTAGEYSYEKSSELLYKIKKGTLTLDANLTEGAADGYGHKTYSLASVSLSLPLCSYRTEAPEGAVITVNGKTVTETPSIKKQEVSKSVPSSFDVPSVATYSFEGFIYRPQITATLDEMACIKVDYEDKVVFKSPYDRKDKTELYDRICICAFSYSDFVAGEFEFGTLKPYLYPNTALYRGLESFDNRWYYSYTSIDNANAEITDFTVISERLIFLHLEYDQLLYDKDRVYKKVPIKLDIYLGCPKSAPNEDPSSWLLVSVEATD